MTDNTKTSRPVLPVGGGYTSLMTEGEAMRTLGILKVEHLRRLVSAHGAKHWPTLEWGRGRHPSLSQTYEGERVYRGEFLRHLAACDDCLPALLAARRADTEVEVMMQISGAVAKEFRFDEWCAEYNVADLDRRGRDQDKGE